MSEAMASCSVEMMGSFDPTAAGRWHYRYERDGDNAPHAAPPPVPSLSARDAFFREASEFIARVGGLPGIGPKFKALETWLGSSGGIAFLDEQSEHIAILEERARSGSNAKDLLGWVRVVQVSLKERGPAISRRDMGQDDVRARRRARAPPPANASVCPMPHTHTRGTRAHPPA